MTPEKTTAEVIQEVESHILSKVIADLIRAKEAVLADQRRLPQKYPELAQEGVVTPTRAAVLHGDLSILAGVLDEAITQARTAATGVLQE